MMFHSALLSIIALATLATGMPAPEFEEVSQDGRTVRLSALREKGPVMLIFLRGFG